MDDDDFDSFGFIVGSALLAAGVYFAYREGLFGVAPAPAPTPAPGGGSGNPPPLPPPPPPPIGGDPWGHGSGNAGDNPAATNISPAGRAFIKTEEVGAHGPYLTKYVDGSGFAIGFAHYIEPGENFDAGITAARAEEIFDDDIFHVDQTITHYVRVPLTQNERDAVGSLVYNIGSGTFASSPVLKALNAGNYQGAAEAFDNYASYGRSGRRLREQALFTNAAAGS
jgi:lysozyme